MALQKKGDAAGAEKELRAALTLDPKLADVRNELGALLNERRRFAEAIVELKRAVADKPDLAEAWFNLGQAAAMQKDCADGARRLRARDASCRRRDADGFINASVAARKCGKLPEATAAARQAVKLAARSPQAHLNLGIALEAAGKLDDAAAEYDVATRIKPDYATAWWSLGLVERQAQEAGRGHRRARQGAHAVADARRASPISASPGATRAISPRRTALFREAVAKDPRYAPARWHLAQVLSAQHKCGEMSKELAALPAAEGQSEAAQKLRTACK